MGNGQSSSLQRCLHTICGEDIGCVSYASNPLYQALWVRPYNLEIPVTPVAVIRPRSAEEVSSAVKCAAIHGVHVQAKSGGHSYANFGLGGHGGGLMIDLVNLKDFEMNTDTWHAALGAGYLLGELDIKLHKNGGRAMAHGICPGVGIGGHATVGGIGPVSRLWGTSLDHVVEAEVVTADGAIRRASEEENPDLFWALRGAGASFGIITKFVVKTHPAPDEVVQYSYSFSFGKLSQMSALYETWQELVGNPDMDRRFSTSFVAYPMGALITGTFYGTKQGFESSRILERLPRGGVLSIEVNDWLSHLAHLAEKATLYLSGIPTHFYSKSLAFRQEDLLGNATIDSLFEYLDETDAGTLLWFILFDSVGGAMADIPENGTAYPHRDKLLMYQSYIIGMPRLSEQSREFARGLHKIIENGAPGAYTTYAGYIDSELQRAEAEKRYWGSNLSRLRHVKEIWDPKDLFRNPQSVDSKRS